MLQEYWASTVIFIEIFSQCTVSKDPSIGILFQLI